MIECCEWGNSGLSCLPSLSLEPFISRSKTVHGGWTVKLSVVDPLNLRWLLTPLVLTLLRNRGRGESLQVNLCVDFYRPSHGAGPGGAPRSLKYSVYCVFSPPVKIWLILHQQEAWESKIKLLSSLQCESSARGHANDFAPEWDCNMSNSTLSKSEFLCCTYLDVHQWIYIFWVFYTRMIHGWAQQASGILRGVSVLHHFLKEPTGSWYFQGTEVKIQVNRGSIQRRSAPGWYNMLTAVNISWFIIMRFEIQQSAVQTSFCP